MGTLIEMVGSFGVAMLMPRWVVVTCALAATLMLIWGMTGIALFAVHKLSGWLLRTCFGSHWERSLTRARPDRLIPTSTR
jgi:hypothetical protein